MIGTTARLFILMMTPICVTSFSASILQSISGEAGMRSTIRVAGTTTTTTPPPPSSHMNGFSFARLHRHHGHYGHGLVLNQSENENNENSDTDDDNTVKPEATDEEMAEMIEVSFVQACLQLAQGYVDVQKLFLAAIKVCYDRKITLPTLIQKVQDCKIQSANRDLSPEEIDARTTSMSLVYLTLETIDKLEGTKDGSNGDECNTSLFVSERIVDTYGGKVEEKVREHLGMEAFSSVPSTDGTSTDPTQDALIGHYEKAVISLTMTILDEEEACDGDGLKARQARPPIPGTS